MRSKKFRGLGRAFGIAAMMIATAGCAPNIENEDVPSFGASPIELPWNSAPIAVDVAAGRTFFFHFLYPNDGSGDPSAQFASVIDPFDVYLCTVSDCGPPFPGNSITPAVTLALGCEISANCQIFTTSPGAPATYWVAVFSAAGASFTIWAAGT